MKVLVMAANDSASAIEFLTKKGHEVVEPHIVQDGIFPDDVVTYSLEIKSTLLNEMAYVHAVYFSGDWRNNDLCKFAHTTATSEGIPVMYEKARRTRRPSPTEPENT